MSDCLKTICCVLLVLALVPTLFGVPNVTLHDKLVAIQHTADDFEPLPDFPDFPRSPTGDDTFFNQIGNFFRYVVALGRWLGEFLFWTFDSVIIVFRILNVLLLNRIPNEVMV